MALPSSSARAPAQTVGREDLFPHMSRIGLAVGHEGIVAVGPVVELDRVDVAFPAASPSPRCPRPRGKIAHKAVPKGALRAVCHIEGGFQNGGFAAAPSDARSPRSPRTGCRSSPAKGPCAAPPGAGFAAPQARSAGRPPPPPAPRAPRLFPGITSTDSPVWNCAFAGKRSMVSPFSSFDGPFGEAAHDPLLEHQEHRHHRDDGDHRRGGH